MFDGRDGSKPLAGLIQGNAGSFYGTTLAGGLANAGTVFEIDSAGALTTLHDFLYESGPYGPVSGLIQVDDGSFYGTSLAGGDFNEGPVYKVYASGKVSRCTCSMA